MSFQFIASSNASNDASTEPMIAEMRLQWWRDVLEKIDKENSTNQHEVVAQLLPVLDAESATMLDQLVQARRWDIYSEPFENADHFTEYLEGTSANLMQVAGRMLGAAEADLALGHLGYASGMANLLAATPLLITKGRTPLIDDQPDVIRALAADALARLNKGWNAVPKSAIPAALPAWRARSLLRKVVRDPTCVIEDRLHQSEFSRRGSLIWYTLRR